MCVSLFASLFLSIIQTDSFLRVAFCLIKSIMQSPAFVWATSSAPQPNSGAPPKDTPPPLSRGMTFLTAGLGGMLGWCIVHPANTLAVRQNLASMQGKPFNFKAMIKESGWLSLYDGIAAGVMRQVFYASTRFGLFETFRDYLHEWRGKTDFASR